MMQGLAEESEVNAGIGDGRRLEVTEPEFKICHSMITGQLPAEFNHARGAVDGDDVPGALGEHLGKRALPCS